MKNDINCDLIETILTKIADIKMSHLIRQYAPDYYKSIGVEAELIPMPITPDLSSVLALEDLNFQLNDYATESILMFPQEDEEMADILEHGKGAKFFNELPMGSHAEAFLSAYLRLLPQKTGSYFVESYDLNETVFYTDSVDNAYEVAGCIAPSVVFKIDRNTEPPIAIELACM